MDRAVIALRQSGYKIDEALLPHIAPVHWNHINLTGDYSWRQNKRVEKDASGPSECPRLNVLYFPYRQTTPNRPLSFCPNVCGTGAAFAFAASSFNLACFATSSACEK